MFTIAAAALALLVSPTAASAQFTTPPAIQPENQSPSQTATQPPIQPAAPDITPPMPDEAMKAYAVVDAALRSWKVPDAAAKDPVSVGACCVTLRARGKVLGRGEAVGGSSCIARATREGMIQAQGGIAALRDEFAYSSMAEAAGMVTIGVEFSGAMIPVEFQTFGEMDRALSPGLDGVAIRIGDKVEATFPSVILQRAIAPSLAAAAAAAQLTGDSLLGLPEAPDAQPAKVRETRKAMYYRFRVRHLVQREAGAPPVFLHRGGKFFDQSRLDVSELRRWADGLARNLVARRWPGEGAIGMSGTDWPALGKTDPAMAGPAEQSLAVVAMCEYLTVRAGVGRFEPAPHAERDPFGVTSLLLADQLLTVEDTEVAPWSDAISAASTIVALHAVQRVVQPRYVPKAELLARLDEPVLASFSPQSGWSASLPVPARGLVAWAMLIRSQGDAAKNELAAKAITSIYLGGTPGRLIAQMPWLGFAELDRAEAAGDIAAVTAYRDMRDLLSAAVFQPTDDDQDMAGGIVFTTSDLQYPTWHTARPVAFLAAMLGDARLTDAAERPRQTARLMSNLRFLRQLSADEYVATAFADPKRTMWGVRSALWDQRQPVEATAITLIAVCETLRSFDRIADAPAPNPPADAGSIPAAK